MSHEQRTPINGIMGMLSIIKSGNLPDGISQYVDLAEESSRNLYLKISDKFRDQAEDKGLHIEICSDVEKLTIEEDRNCLSQILIYLISNAVKFSEKGSILIELNNHIDGISISVKDEGIGIPENQIKYIFDPFRLLEDAYTKSYSGMGAGLAITKLICEMINASVEVQSDPGKGTVFTLKLSQGIIYTENNEDQLDGNVGILSKDNSLKKIKNIISGR